MVKPIFCSNEYLVDSRGFVIGKNGKPLKPSINHKGYEIVNLTIDGKRVGIAVHTLVARAFCDGYNPKKQVNHKDGNKTKNDYENLEWLTPKENTQHSRDVLGFNNRGNNHCFAQKIIGFDKIQIKKYMNLIALLMLEDISLMVMKKLLDTSRTQFGESCLG